MTTNVITISSDDLPRIKRHLKSVQAEAFSKDEMGNAGPAGFASDHLRSFIERLERLEEDKKAITNDIKDVFAEAKGTGFDVKIMKQVLRLRKQGKAEREEQEAILDLYLRALGMIFGGGGE
jgi:uncharacterized protein (UPF0335 family)